MVVALVQADARLVEDVEHADQTGTDLGRQTDALGLPARQRAGGAVEREVVQADVDQEAQSFVDLLEDAESDLLLAGRQLEGQQEVGRIADRQCCDLGDRSAAQGDSQRDRLQA